VSVHVWLMKVDLPDVPALTTMLDPDERRRAALLALDAHRRRFVAAHGVARVIIGHWLSVPADRIGWQRGLHGKPELTGTPEGTQVNLSHSGELALLAITEHRHCGVDLQQLPDATQAVRLARRFFPAEETRLVTADPDPVRTFGVLWTRKEASLKVAGGRLMPGMRLPVHGPVTDEGAVVVRDPGGPLPGPYLVRDLAAPDGFRAAVAVSGERPCPVVRHWWPAELDHDLDPHVFLDTMAVEQCSTVTLA
jgi:4'-phosphopantetheinyl transferase